MKTIRFDQTTTYAIMDSLRAANFPLDALIQVPITAIEGMSTKIGDTFKGVCARACLGCSADAVHPILVRGTTKIMAPDLLQAILMLMEKLASQGFEILSTEDFKLFSGSNELDHPYCLELRNIISKYYSQLYGFPIGAISADLVFHVSPTNRFKKNLFDMMSEPILFDNICIAIDEQMPMKGEGDYARYLDQLSWVWHVLHPALTLELEHARPLRRREPRVILNLLLPDPENSYQEQFSNLYPSGPARAITYKELARRYVEPFVGSIETINDPIPSDHIFTTGIAHLSQVPNSKVYISEAVFEPVGRANEYLSIPDYYSDKTVYLPTIRTKIYPVNQTSFTIQACLAPNPVSEGVIPWNEDEKPYWVTVLEEIVIDVSALLHPK